MIKTIFLLFTLFLTACASVKDTFTLKKKSSADEFLVEKKSPLVMPPDYEKLPKPITEKSNQSTQNINQTDEIEKLLSNKKISASEKKIKISPSIEKLILEKIK